MGFSHYYTQKRNLTPKEMKGLALFADAAALRSGTPLAGPEGEPGTAPIFTAALVSFNGVGDDAHETFEIDPKGSGFQFTKTARKPYDIVVVACLAYLDTLGNAFAISSDGDLDDWAAGIELARRVRPGLDFAIRFED